MFGIVRVLVDPFRIGIAYIHKLVRRIFPIEMKMVAYSTQHVLIMMVYEASKDIQTTTKTNDVVSSILLTVEIDEKRTLERVPRAMTHPPMSEPPQSSQNMLENNCRSPVEHAIMTSLSVQHGSPIHGWFQVKAILSPAFKWSKLRPQHREPDTKRKNRLSFLCVHSR